MLPKTLAQDCYGTDGKDVNTLIAEGLQMTAGGYIGTGTSGEGAPNTLAFGFAPRLLVLYKADDGEAVILGAAAAAGSGRWAASATRFPPAERAGTHRLRQRR